MKIIVTGCKGQLGTEILKQLREGRSEIGPIPEKLLNATVIAVDLPDLDISNYKICLLYTSPVRCLRRMPSSISSQKTPKYKKLGKKEKQPKIFRS